MAEAYYNNLTKSKKAFSAGLDPKTPSKYKTLPNQIIKLMKEEGIDVSKNVVKEITNKDIENAKRLYVMCGKEQCPKSILKSNKVTFWKITDPYKASLEKTREIRDQIKELVKSII